LFNIDNQTVVTEAQNYLRIVTSFGFAYFLVNLFNGIYDGLGKTINTFFVMAVGLVLNMILDPLFILVLGLGVSGAALATGISQFITLLIYVGIYLSSKRPAIIKIKTYYALNKIKDIIKLGLPVGIQSMIMTSISIGIGVMVAEYGEAVMSVSRIGSQIEALSWMVASGFQVALASFVGQNVGANQYGRVKKGYITSMAMLVPYGLAVNALLYFGARPLFKIFIANEETLAHGIDYLKIISISQLFMILDLVTAGAFNGLGKTKIPSAIQIVGNGLRIPLALWLTGILMPSVHGIWWAVSLSSVFKGSVLVIIFVGYILYLNKHGGLSKVENYQAL
jgi:Na+-driven multidrug efflux pump